MDVSRRAISSVTQQHSFYVDWLAPQPAERILDAGCGGGATIRIGIEAAPSSFWHGVDSNPSFLSTARAATNGVVDLTLGDLRWLPYGDDVFDGIISRDTLECIPEPLEAIDELVRTLRPGGRLLLCHWDWYSQRFGVSDLEMARRLVVAFAETQQAWMEAVDPAMGRKLTGLAASVAEIEILEAGVLTLAEQDWTAGRFGHEQAIAMSELLGRRAKMSEAEVKTWLGMLEAAHSSGTYSYTIDHYWVLARKR